MAEHDRPALRVGLGGFPLPQQDGGFAVGQPLHALVVDDGVLAEPVRPLTLRERFERCIYLMGKDAIRAVWSDGRQVV